MSSMTDLLDPFEIMTTLGGVGWVSSTCIALRTSLLYRVEDIIDYLQTLRVSQGRRAGELLTLMPWQLQFLRGTFVDDGSVTDSCISVARNSGKTTLLAGIGAAAIDGPLAIPRGRDADSRQLSFEQGLILWRHLLNFLKPMLDADEELPLKQRRFRVWDTSSQARITDRVNGCVVRVIGSDARRAHGAAPSLTICDEMAVWPPAGPRECWQL